MPQSVCGVGGHLLGLNSCCPPCWGRDILFLLLYCAPLITAPAFLMVPGNKRCHQSCVVLWHTEPLLWCIVTLVKKLCHRTCWMAQWIKTPATKPDTPEINTQDSLCGKRIFPKLPSDPNMCTRTCVYICVPKHTRTFLKMYLFLCAIFKTCICICMLCSCLMLLESRRRCWIPRNWREFWTVVSCYMGAGNLAQTFCKTRKCA